MVPVDSLGLHFERCWAAAGVKVTLRVYRPEVGRAAHNVISPERLSQSSAALMLLLRIKVVIMDLAVHVSAHATEPNEPAKNTLPFPCARDRMHATHEPD